MSGMSTWIWIVIAVIAVIVVLAVIAAMVSSMRSRRRTGELRSQFGREYERTISSAASRREGEEDLEARRKHRSELEIRELPQASKDRYLSSWREVQAQFVDDPQIAVAGADSLIKSVMSERGYPVDDFEQRAADVSVDHPDVVEHYREADRLMSTGGNGSVPTEALRQAMQHYRALFEELVGANGDASVAGRGQPTTVEDERVAG
jgi:FtsZ-interacting cell division protein ZipA